MANGFDTVLTSSDLSLERVLKAGLPVAMIFYDRELPSEYRQTLDELARRYAGRALLVRLARSDAPQAISRYNLSRLPAIVTVRDDRTVTRQDSFLSRDAARHVAHLLGEGPAPAVQSSIVNPENATGPISVGAQDFDREVLQSDRPVLVDFWAPWCAPCRMVAPTLEALAREKSTALKVVKVNVDENPGLASRYRAMSIPTLLIFKGGREVDRWVGAQPEPVIRSRVARWIQEERQAA
ncbi:MAG TPA: thioredoxin [Anaerolineales bacterium]|nr:thioredoxin [Anaerolineales bacterium]